MSATTTQAPRTTGKTMVLATYQCDEGTRQLVGQRIDGLVQITDRRPAGGRAYLVDQGFENMAEVQALIDDYTAKAKRLGYAPMQGWFWPTRPSLNGERRSQAPSATPTSSLAGARP